MLTRSYVIREFSKEGIMTRPVATMWSEGRPGEYMFGDSYSDEQFKSRGDAEKAIYDFFLRLWRREGGPMYINPCYTVVELFGFEGE